jgi:hypothetical protein
VRSPTSRPPRAAHARAPPAARSAEEHAALESLARNRISNVSFAVSSAGEILILAVMVGIVEALRAGDSAANNTRAFSVLCAFSGGVWREPPGAFAGVGGALICIQCYARYRGSRSSNDVRASRSRAARRCSRSASGRRTSRCVSACASSKRFCT